MAPLTGQIAIKQVIFQNGIILENLFLKYSSQEIESHDQEIKIVIYIIYIYIYTYIEKSGASGNTPFTNVTEWALWPVFFI